MRLRSSGAKNQIKEHQPINISPRWGEEANNVLLHFQVESANLKLINEKPSSLRNNLFLD
jgi:hypothetical protein